MKDVIYGETDFEKAMYKFQRYKPVKVARESKDKFHHAISKYFIEIGTPGWSATMTPLKKSWKFQRTKFKNDL